MGKQTFSRQRLWLGLISIGVLVAVWMLISSSAALAQVTCTNPQRLQLSQVKSVGGATGSTCLAVSIPRFTDAIEIAFEGTAGDGTHDVYWESNGRYTPIATRLDANRGNYMLTVPDYRPASSEKFHKIVVVPSVSSPYWTLTSVYAKDVRGRVLNETVGAASGTGTMVGIPLVAGQGYTHEVLPGQRATEYFTARCGVINFSTTWRYETGGGNWDNLHLHLYDPTGQLVHRLPVGTAEGNLFRLSYPVSQEQVRNGALWTVEMVNRSNWPVMATGVLTSADNDCPEVVTPPTAPTGGAAYTLTIMDINVRHDSDSDGPGDISLDINVNGTQRRWPSSGTFSADEKNTYSIRERFPIVDSNSISLVVRGTEHDDHNADDDFGTVRYTISGADLRRGRTYEVRAAPSDACDSGCYILRFRVD
jgi:hypothetical protein